MKRLILGALLMVSMAVSAQIDSLEQSLPWSQNMQAKLDSMMHDPLLDYTQMGLMVWDLTDDKSLFSKDQRQLLRPASTMKLLTAITSLDYLGTDYQFTTSLYYTGEMKNHQLEGDLYCVGGMDPAFSQEDMQAFVAGIKQLGITSIRGNIVFDKSMKDTLKWGEGWCWDDKNPTLSPLLVDRKADFAEQFVSMLSSNDINLEETTLIEGDLPEDATLITACKRHIDQILLRMLKDSDNLYAEAIYFQIAARTEHPAKALYAQRQQRALLERAGLRSGVYRLADGSGLSLYNYLSAESLLQILRYAYKRQHIYKHLLPALPVAGEDGTLKKRMRDTAAEGNVQAKTGTLTGIISLAGYCTASNGHRLCFAIINQGVQRAREARDFQDKICNIICE